MWWTIFIKSRFYHLLDYNQWNAFHQLLGCDPVTGFDQVTGLISWGIMFSLAGKRCLSADSCFSGNKLSANKLCQLPDLSRLVEFAMPRITWQLFIRNRFFFGRKFYQSSDLSGNAFRWADQWLQGYRSEGRKGCSWVNGCLPANRSLSRKTFLWRNRFLWGNQFSSALESDQVTDLYQ